MGGKMYDRESIMQKYMGGYDNPGTSNPALAALAGLSAAGSGIAMWISLEIHLLSLSFAL